MAASSETVAVTASQQPSSSVIVAGATGAIGREFVLQAVSDEFFSRVVALSRRDIPESSWNDTWPGIDMALARQKLKVYAMDWEALANAAGLKAGSTDGGYDAKASTDNANLATQIDAAVKNAKEAFSGNQFAVNLLGSACEDAGSAKAFHRYDYDYYAAYVDAVKAFNPPLATASSSSSSAVTHFSQISSTGASATSWLLYPRTKGLADEMLMKKGYFNYLSIWRPGLPSLEEMVRTGEKIDLCLMSAMPVERVVAAIIREFKKREGFAEGSKIGEAETCKDAAGSSSAVRVYHNKDIMALTDNFGKAGSSSSCCGKPSDTADHKSDLQL